MRRFPGWLLPVFLVLMNCLASVRGAERQLYPFGSREHVIEQLVVRNYGSASYNPTLSVSITESDGGDAVAIEYLVPGPYFRLRNFLTRTVRFSARFFGIPEMKSYVSFTLSPQIEKGGKRKSLGKIGLNRQVGEQVIWANMNAARLARLLRSRGVLKLNRKYIQEFRAPSLPLSPGPKPDVESFRAPLSIKRCKEDCAEVDGACSSHGGVDCRRGPDVDGSVICKDDWKNSKVLYQCSGSKAKRTRKKKEYDPRDFKFTLEPRPVLAAVFSRAHWTAPQTFGLDFFNDAHSPIEITGMVIVTMAGDVVRLTRASDYLRKKRIMFLIQILKLYEDDVEQNTYFEEYDALLAEMKEANTTNARDSGLVFFVAVGGMSGIEKEMRIYHSLSKKPMIDR